MNFKQTMEMKIGQIESCIRQYLPEECGKQSRLIEAMNYSILAGGKRLRPLLMSESYRLFGGCGKEIEPFMAAMEMIHTYSLVHDDLPAMDNDEFRRGRKTTHIVFGEAMGILAGDGLLNLAVETAMCAFDMTQFPDRTANALRTLMHKSGLYGMIGGQSVDVLAEGQSDVTIETLDFIYALKTGALIEASMMIGAILAGASKPEVREIELAAGEIGRAFQIQDDILDVVSTTQQLGKPAHSDEKNGKTTYVTLLGVEEAKRRVRTLSERAAARLDTFSGDAAFLKQLFYSLIKREA
ncbi:MAG: polyprenyl synthetase family protein [Lachnospiraceae bacterium]